MRITLQIADHRAKIFLKFLSTLPHVRILEEPVNASAIDMTDFLSLMPYGEQVKGESYTFKIHVGSDDEIGS